MKVLDLKYDVLDALEITCNDNNNCVYSDADFLRHLNTVVEGIAVDILGKDLTSYINLKKRVYDIKLPNVKGARGYAGRYSLPGDILKLKKVEVSLDGTCWVEGVPSVDNLSFKYNCNNCPCPEPNCGIKLLITDTHLTIDPLPTKDVAKGLVMWYEAYPDKITSIEQTLPFKGIDHAYIALLIADYYMAVHTDRFATAKVNRLFNKFNRAKKRFDKIHNLQTKKRVQKKHQRPYN
jgi:hypothetical protein